MNRHICLHGHFYQPPRENPWLEEVELQESAQPYHDWNERITAECYARNGASRILNTNGHITEIVNNYSRISFNMGPTLLSWMEKKDPEAYRSILEADRLSRQRFSGHGSALAQVYNHMIMPLANARDKRTQVIWGIRDFEFRFGVRPEGMWLAETAVDLDSLDIMAEMGIKFTILAPHQAKRAKLLSEEREWKPEDEESIDHRRPYTCKLPSGRTIAIFFYDGPISRAVAFEGLLHSGETLAHRVLGAFDAEAEKNQLVHIATDGESYGHHHKFGDMALAYCLHYIEKNDLARLTIYGEYLERNKPEYEVEIVENSSWSCMHGIERWRGDCGCNSGGNPGWNQEWRGPLRTSLDWLRDRAAVIFEREMAPFTDDPWGLRNAYIEVILDRSRYNTEKFLSSHIHKPLSAEEKNRVLRCLEIQRNALLMYTSCGWFFDDISGIETVQIIKYAARVIQLIGRVSDEDLELGFLELLGKAKSNVTAANNGARVYKSYVEPSIVDILRVGAHYAMSSLYNNYPTDAKLYCYTVHRKVYDKQSIGKLELVLGRAEIVSDITWTGFQVQFAVLHLGDQNFICGVDHFHEEAEYQKMQAEISEAFVEGDVPRTIHAINRYFGAKNYSLWHLFKHEQQVILEQIFDTTMKELDSSFRQIYDDHFSLIRMINENHLPLPKALSNVVEFILLRDLTSLLSMPDVPLDRLGRLVREINRWQFKRDKEELDFLGSRKLNEMMARFKKNPNDHVLLEHIVEIMKLLNVLKLNLDLWRAQNIFYAISQDFYRQKRAAADKEDAAKSWIGSFEFLGSMLKVHLP